MGHSGGPSSHDLGRALGAMPSCPPSQGCTTAKPTQPEAKDLLVPPRKPISPGQSGRGGRELNPQGRN